MKRLFIRELPKGEEYVDSDRRKLNLLGYIFCQLEAGNSKLQTGRILVAEKGAKSLIGREWLNAFNYKFISPNQKESKPASYRINPKVEEQAKINKTSEVTNTSEINFNNEINEQPKLKEQFKPFFTRQRRFEGHEVKTQFKNEGKITQEKRRRVPIELQEAVQREKEILLKEGHIEKVTEVTDKQLIQPIVITVKRDKSVKIPLDARALNNQLIKDSEFRASD